MAAPSDYSNAQSVARVLNLNSVDSSAYFDVINDYFGERDEDDYDSCSDRDDEQGAVDSDLDSESEEREQYLPVTVDLAEAFVPLANAREPLATLPHNTQDLASPTQPPAQTKPPCNCKLNDGKPCHTHFHPQDIENFTLQYVALTSHELDIVVLSKIACGLHLDKDTRSTKRSAQSERKASRADYSHHGHRICRNFFKFIHSISQDKLTALIKHYKACGVEARIHKNTKRQPRKALHYEDTRRVIDFIVNYAEIHGIQLPSRTPKHWVTDCKLLPTNCTKASVYSEYAAAASVGGHRVVKLRTFRHLWQTILPFICTMPPASDLCWVCQQGAARIARSANKPDQQKKDSVCQLEEHLQSVQKERQFYQEICASVKADLPVNIERGQHPFCSFRGKNHISFDYAQQVHFPFNPLQPGPIYFKTPRKCGLFGVNCESIGKQVNFVIDEAHCSGKGANVVVSYLHYYLENFSFGETDLYLHADNCCGQNKNSTMMMYLMWRCHTGRNEKICLSFLISGHTKFSPDGGFGLIKRKYRKTKVDCLQNIADVINSSSVMNEAVLVGEENGDTLIPASDWTTFLSGYFKRVKDVKKYQHFLFDSSPNILCKKSVDAGEETQKLLIHPPPTGSMPRVIPANGLSDKRRWYLFKEIRPFVDDKYQDIVAPRPLTLTAEDQEEDSESESEEEAVNPPPPAKKQRGDSQHPSRGRGRGLNRGRGGRYKH